MEQAYKGIRVLVTGASGFIGSRLTVALVEAGAEVSAVVHSKQHVELIDSVIQKITLYEADLGNSHEAESVVKEARPNIVFNTASSTDTRRDFSMLDSVVAGTFDVSRSVVGACITVGVQKLVHFGTIEEYGTNAAPFFETMREAPMSPYSLGKTMATHMALLAGKLTPLKVCVLRPAATYGPGKSFTMLIPSVIKAGIERKDFDMNDGEQLRDFVYVDDLVEGALVAGISEKVNGEIINLGSGKPTKVREVVEMVNGAMGNPIKINFGAEEYRPLDGEFFYMNSDKAFNLLHWKASTDITDGIEKTVRWYCENYKDLSARG